MALAPDQHSQTCRYPWYWDDHADYDCSEASVTSYHQNHASSEKHFPLHQNQRLLGMKRPCDGHDEDAALVIAQGDLHEGEIRGRELHRIPSFMPLSAASNLNFTSNLITTRAFSNTLINARHRGCHVSENSEPVQQPSREAYSSPEPSSGSGFSGLSSSTHLVPSSPLITPSESPSLKRKPSSSLPAVAFDEIRVVRTSDSLLRHLHTSTCVGNAEMAVDKRKRGWERRERKVAQIQEVDGTATPRFPQSQPPSLPPHSTTLEDMECIFEEEEGYEKTSLSVGSGTEEAVDGEERGRSGYSQSRSGYTTGGRSSNEYSHTNGHTNYRYPAGRGRTSLNGNGRDDGDDEDERGSNGDGPLDYYFSHHFTTSEEEDDSEEDESNEGSSSGLAKRSMVRPSRYHRSSSTHRQKDRRVPQPHPTSSSPHSDSDEDDVPLAQSHPTALRAQQSIRIKDRQRRTERKLEKEREKAVREKQVSTMNGDVPGGSTANGAFGLGGMSSTQEAMLHASTKSRTSFETPVPPFAAMAISSSPPPSSPLPTMTAFPTSPNPGHATTSPKLNDCTTLPSTVPAGTVRLRSQRGRTRTLTGNGSNVPSGQQESVPPTPHLNQTFPAQVPNNMGMKKTEPQNLARALKPMRSFHVQRVNNMLSPQQAAQDYPPVPVPMAPTAPATSLTRSHTRARSQSNAYVHPVSASAPPLPSHTPAVPATTSRARSRSRPPPTRNPYAADEFGQISHNGNAIEPLARRSTESRRIANGSGSARSSAEHARERVEVPPVELMPPLPSSLAPHSSAPLEATQLRVYISTRQRFVVAEITSITNAGDVVGMVRAKGSLPDVQSGLDISSGVGGVGVPHGGGWMVWEINADLGMERPIRPFEKLVEVQGSWSKDKTENVFMMKWTPGWEQMLRREAIPPSAPTYSGYLEYEVRRGKWDKRWLVLRDHCLYISKRDTRKDEALLCSLSNFDVYHFTNPPAKVPKEYAFAIKSTDKMSLFEDTNDYMHLFSTRGSEGEKWVQRIRIARSYVLYQERNVLFAPPPSQASPLSPTLNGTGLGRAPNAKRRVPMQPLLQVADDGIFAKGSLLRSQV